MSDLDFNSNQYQVEISDIASDLYDEALEQNDKDQELAMEAIHDRMLHELVDGHEWVIYTYSNDLVARSSNNSEAYLNCYDNETIGQIVAENGLDAVKSIIAYFAMYQDISDEIYRLNRLYEAA